MIRSPLRAALDSVIAHRLQLANGKERSMTNSAMLTRLYRDPGDRMSGRFDPPRLCRVLVRWGPGGGPRNVLVEYLDDQSRAIVPFSRRLRRARGAQ